MDTIYFDHAATTPLDEAVLEAMLPWLRDEFGNPSSLHHKGQSAKVALEDARESIADRIGAEPSEIIFTSGGTESDNTAIKGGFELAGKKRKIISSKVEHHAVIHPIEALRRHGAEAVFLQPDSTGRIDPQQVADELDEHTALVSLMHVNNELGTINPIREIADLCHEQEIPFHTDAVQSIGKLAVDVDELGVDLLSMSGHKIYGPKGVGVLYVRNGTEWLPWMHGGSQERRRRGGTSNIPGIVGLQKALELTTDLVDAHQTHFQELRSHLLNRLRTSFGDRLHINGPEEGGVPHIVNIAFHSPREESFDGEMFLLNLDIEGVCVSSGSACTSGAIDPSHVLMNIGLEPALSNTSLRISFGKSNSTEEIDLFIEKLENVLERMLAVA